MNQSANSSTPLTWRSMLSYGAGDFGLNFYWQGTGFFLLFFYTDVIGLPNLTAGLIYAIGGFVDAVSDPAMGVIGDRTRTKWGQYRPYLLFGAIPLGVSFIILFTLPSLAPPGWVMAVALLSHIGFRLCYTAVSIPYGALGTRLTFDAGQRTKLAGVRMMCGAFGGVVIVMLASSLRQFVPDIQAFAFFSIAAGLIGIPILFLSFVGTREQPIIVRNRSIDKPISNNFGLSAHSILMNRPFVILVGSIFLLTIANMITIKMVLYRFDHILHAPAASAVTLTLMTAVPLLAIPAWVWLYLKLDKRPAFLVGCSVVLFSLLILLFVGNDNIVVTTIAYVLIAAGFSSFAVGFWSILPDTIDYGHWKSEIRIESSLIGIASAMQKCAIALSGLAVGGMLDLLNYRANETQSEATLHALHGFSTLIPIVLIILTAALFNWYPISSDRHSQILKALK